MKTEKCRRCGNLRTDIKHREECNKKVAEEMIKWIKESG